MKNGKQKSTFAVLMDWFCRIGIWVVGFVLAGLLSVAFVLLVEV